MQKMHELLKRTGLLRLGPAPGIVCLLSFIAAAIVTVTYNNLEMSGMGDISDFEVGRVADRDITADFALSYIDEYATRLRMEAQESLVPAVFRYSSDVVEYVLGDWDAFCDFIDQLEMEEVSLNSMWLTIQAGYPAWFPDEALAAYLSAPDRQQFREYGLEILGALYVQGVFSLGVDLRNYNPDIVEVLFTHHYRTERESVHFSDIITLDNCGQAITRIAVAQGLSQEFRAIAHALLGPFIRVNVLYSSEDSQVRVTEAMERVIPVMRNIDKGMRVIRRGFVITADEMLDLQALQASFPRQDPRSNIGIVLLIASLYMFFILLQDKIVHIRASHTGESCLLFILVFLYLAGSALTRNLTPALSNFPSSIFFPTALLVMIPAVFMGPLLALALAMAFPLCASIAGFFDIPSFIFALASGAAAAVALRKAEKRMDIIKAGMIIAAVNCAAIIVILLMQAAGLAEYPRMLFWAALNGIVSGMLFLGVLAPLEHFLNAATTFRLIELSDLNAPILRKLFTTAPGTYSHSVMVATLAEQACADIGANALLARVGAYYHDVGKMDNPDYFVENQTNHNRHDDIAPRLSATVIRSHVKVGVEKARNLNLPEDVIEIIAEHHGNSLITWFYNKATQQEDDVNSDDFAYTSSPPRSRESAIVMLADVTEAATRTLVKPTVARMEKFLQQLFDAKVEHGQLAQSDLTFRDLETIKKAFVKVLAGYYHSRIEYPKVDSEMKEDPQ